MRQSMLQMFLKTLLISALALLVLGCAKADVTPDDPYTCNWVNNIADLKINNQPVHLDAKSVVHLTQVGHSKIYEARNAANELYYRATIMNKYLKLETGKPVIGDVAFLIQWDHFAGYDDFHNYLNKPTMSDQTYTKLSGPNAFCHFTTWNDQAKFHAINVQHIHV